jgi:hypothetical protein
VSGPGNVIAIGGCQTGVTPSSRGYHFDLTPVLAHCESLRRHPERAIVMCQHQVRLLAPGELLLARDSGFYLIVQSCTGTAADALANGVNMALLALFFGTDSLNGIAALFRPVTYGEMSEVGIALATPQAVAPTAQVLAAGTRPSSFDALNRNPDPLAHLAQYALPGYEGLKSGFLPMFNIQRDTPLIHMCGAVARRHGRLVFGPVALRECASKDRPSLDEAMLEYSLGFTRQIIPTKFTAAISTSVSYETLAWSRGRQVYQKALRTADVVNNPFLVVKIDEVPPGTPPSRLAEIVATVRPFVKRVVLHLPDCDFGLIQSGQIGAAALCATLPANATPLAIARFAARLNRVAMGQQALSCVDGIDNFGALPLLRAAGIRFAAGCADENSLHLGNPLDGLLSARVA